MFLHKIDDELALKLVEPQDAEAIFDLTEQSRHSLREWLPWLDVTRTVTDTQAFIQAARKGYGENRSMTAVILFHRIRKERVRATKVQPAPENLASPSSLNNETAGLISFNEINWANKTAQIGYWLGSQYQGRGIMTRAASALTDYAFRELGLHKVEIRAAVGNSKSRAIPERLGFKQEGCIRSGEWLYDHYVDHVVYGVLDSEWAVNAPREK
ncbi:GNAT family N-acetyltransferase [Sporolactobacillus terrae]|uniref:RimJ/RimL family protein N-acetyltransferase n=1 Tax=Sporolactobacillus terrae TaxID=269673 RepID=A0ABX5Q4C1_9BACL|nr:GNAT family protein [Sporolactobacillus terrae]QAA21497.1 RimJ/RimL family protein N-acetyltransferase [Sporolactobacillus terrae]QAA24469.1 RimJ/RimL family protein N-acetyltransferase [Sporolactobacillus terrae]UAK16296.1 GNAT family N-acetyltransferase [Sporolactobacillus terrae]